MSAAVEEATSVGAAGLSVAASVAAAAMATASLSPRPVTVDRADALDHGRVAWTGGTALDAAAAAAASALAAAATAINEAT